MKKFSFFIAIVLISTITFAQKDQEDYDAWKAPIILQLQAKSSNVMSFGAKDVKDKWLNIAILDKTARIVYWINCQGYVIDELPVPDETTYKELLERRYDPFEFHQLFWQTDLEMADAAIYKFRFPGTIARYAGIPAYDKRVEAQFLAPDVRTEKTSVERLAALFKERQIALLNLMRCKAPHPDKVILDAAFKRPSNDYFQLGRIRTNAAGTDTATLAQFYSKDWVSPVYKAVLNIAASKLYFYMRDQTIFDSVNVSPANAHKLIDEKINVFALYQNLKEWQLSQADSIEQQLTNPNERRSNFTQALLASYNGDRQALLLSIYRSQDKLENDLSVLSSADAHFFEQDIKYNISNEDPLTLGNLQSDGTIFEYTYCGQLRGAKSYELTDHRGNVMVVVSDSKKQISNDGVTVDHYEPNVVKATDYSSFGVPLEGRTFQMEKYDYGYNGKRDDNETGYLDYGDRMYDPNIGRFFNIDPATKYSADWSPYVYAYDNPISLIDDNGDFGDDPRGKFYKTMGTAAIKAITSANVNTNKFKALYALAQYRAENGFSLNPPGNNPFNLKGKGDAGQVTYLTTEYVKGKSVKVQQSFASFSTLQKGFEGYLKTLKEDYSDASKALYDNSKNITDFANAIQNGKNGVYATDPDYANQLKTILGGVVHDYEKDINNQIQQNNNQIQQNNDILNSKTATEKQKSTATKSNNNLNNSNHSLNKDLNELQEFKKNEKLDK